MDPAVASVSCSSRNYSDKGAAALRAQASQDRDDRTCECLSERADLPRRQHLIPRQMMLPRPTAPPARATLRPARTETAANTPFLSRTAQSPRTTTQKITQKK